MKGTEGLGVPPTNKNGKEKQKKKTSLTFQYEDHCICLKYY